MKPARRHRHLVVGSHRAGGLYVAGEDEDSFSSSFFFLEPWCFFFREKGEDFVLERRRKDEK